MTQFTSICIYDVTAAQVVSQMHLFQNSLFISMRSRVREKYL